jgi:hypothetical protein
MINSMEKSHLPGDDGNSGKESISRLFKIGKIIGTLAEAWQVTFPIQL